jgi:hypothetical protein
MRFRRRCRNLQIIQALEQVNADDATQAAAFAKHNHQHSNLIPLARMGECSTMLCRKLFCYTTTATHNYLEGTDSTAPPQQLLTTLRKQPTGPVTRIQLPQAVAVWNLPSRVSPYKEQHRSNQWPTPHRPPLQPPLPMYPRRQQQYDCRNHGGCIPNGPDKRQQRSIPAAHHVGIFRRDTTVPATIVTTVHRGDDAKITGRRTAKSTDTNAPPASESFASHSIWRWWRLI